MHGPDLLAQAVVYLAAAVVMVPLSRRLGLGSVLGYLLAGVLIGPFGLRLVGAEGQGVLHVAEFGVVLMLFLVGLELQPSLLWKLRGPLFGLGGLQVALTALALAAAAMASGVPWRVALAGGLVLAMSSTAIVLQTLQEKGLLGTEGGQRAFSVLLFQDLAVIPILALLPLLASAPVTHAADHARPWIETLAPGARAAVTLGAVGAVVLAGRLAVGPAFRLLAASRVREILTAAALLLVVAIAWLMTQVGLSPALGTFVAGVVLANSEFRHELESDIEPFKGLLLGLFFIAVGSAIDFRLLADDPARLTALVLGFVAVKAAVLWLLGLAFRLGRAPRALFAVSLAQGGEFAFVLASFATGVGVFSAAQAGTVVAAVALSMALAPLLFLAEERLLRPRFAPRGGPERQADVVSEHQPVLVAGFGHFGSTVGRLLSARGVKATVLDADSGNVERLRRLGLEVFYGDASRADLLHAAGVERAALVVVATGEHETTLGIVRTVRRIAPAAQVYARARGRFEAYELLEAGAHHVYRDTLDTSLRLGVDALHALGQPAHPTLRAAQAFRRADERSVHDLLGVRHDREAYLRTARQRIRDLEQRLLDEMERPAPDDDGAWDAETLREEFAERPPER